MYHRVPEHLAEGHRVVEAAGQVAAQGLEAVGAPELLTAVVQLHLVGGDAQGEHARLARRGRGGGHEHGGEHRRGRLRGSPLDGAPVQAVEVPPSDPEVDECRSLACRADFNGDGVVSGADFAIFVRAFNTSCE